MKHALHSLFLIIALAQPIYPVHAKYSHQLTPEQTSCVLIGSLLAVTALIIATERFFNPPQEQFKREIERYQHNADLYKQARILAQEIQTLSPQQFSEALALENRIITLLLGEVSVSTTLPYNNIAWTIKTKINELTQSVSKINKFLHHEALIEHYKECKTLKDNNTQLKLELQLLLGILTKQPIYSDEMNRLAGTMRYRGNVRCSCSPFSIYECYNCNYNKYPASNFNQH